MKNYLMSIGSYMLVMGLILGIGWICVWVVSWIHGHLSPNVFAGLVAISIGFVLANWAYAYE